MRKYVTILIACVLVASCSTTKISFDYDTDANFAKYTSYAFDEDTKDLPINQLDRDRFIKAAENEMAAKGFIKSDDPDLIVNLMITAKKQVQANATSTGAGYGPYRYGWGGGFTSTQVNYTEYVDGTLIISFIDKAENNIVWQGRGTKTINESASTEQKEANINAVVKQILTKYPPTK